MIIFKSKPDDLSYLDISRLTFEAVLEVVIICFAGFIAAKTGLLNTNGQKVISALNVDLFTPCLVFSKLAPSLSLEKMVDIIIIPIFYFLSTGISFLSSKFMGKILALNEPETDFVTAMAVFGNSNSLPVSLTLSLAYTLPDLYWDDIENDTKEGIASRGILYLLIFQQLGQILRWSWGYNKLLRKRSHEELHTYRFKTDNEETIYNNITDDTIQVDSSEDNDETTSLLSRPPTSYTITESNVDSNVTSIAPSTASIKFTAKLKNFGKNVLDFMNPPLYAMLISIIIATVPKLQEIFFTKGTFISNTVTKSITQLGSVSIPLILIVLGSNLYPSKDIPPPSKHYNKIIFGSLLSRMILPSIILLPLITLCVKFFKISILDDPIFLLVAFILTTSPPAIQLSQITQLNGIYQKEMSGVLFWGYVVFSLPSTMLVVVTSLEVLKWANP